MMDRKYGSIYLIVNKINDKKYIGQTIFLVEERWKSHINYPKNYIGRAIQKYGKENFIFMELCQACNEFDLNYLEEYFIKYYNTTESSKGYNLTYGGDASSGKFTPEVRNKMRLAKLGKKRNSYKVNQSGSSKTKEIEHAQRLEGETVKTEYNPSTSSRQPSKYRILKNEIIKEYLETNSSYKVAEKFDLDKSHIVRYLKTWNVVCNQSNAASIRNKNRYVVEQKVKNSIIETYKVLNSGNKTAKFLNISRKTVYRVLKAEDIV